MSPIGPWTAGNWQIDTNDFYSFWGIGDHPLFVPATHIYIYIYIHRPQQGYLLSPWIIFGMTCWGWCLDHNWYWMISHSPWPHGPMAPWFHGSSYSSSPSLSKSSRHSQSFPSQASQGDGNGDFPKARTVSLRTLPLRAVRLYVNVISLI